MMQSRVIAQQEQYQQQLWRPSGELLHLLTEGKRQAADLEELHGGGRYQSSSGAEEEAMVSKRQAPAVWRPPIGMKPNCPLAPPVIDEWQLCKQEEPSALLLAGEKRSDDSSGQRVQGNHFHNGGRGSPSDLSNLMGSRTNSSSGNAHHLDSERNDLSTTTDEELMPAPRTAFADPTKLFQASSSSPFSSSGRREEDSQGGKLPSPFIKQQAVPPTPLFSGLGSVSFGSGAGFLKPPATNVFAHSPPLAFGRILRNSSDEELPNQDQVPPQVSTVKHLSSTNSASEKGSSDSQTGKTAVATESNGGFKPSGLAGKSLVPESPAKAGKSTSGRKLRTRPLDLLMNALQGDAPAKATRLGSRISNSGAQLNTSSSARDAGAGAQDGPAQTANTRNSSASRAPKPTRNSARQESLQKQEQDRQQQQEQQQQRKGAFFVHTGVWIVQKKSSRHTKSAFRKKSSEEEQNQIVPVASHRRQAPPKGRNGHHPQQGTTVGTTTTTTRPTSTKKRSLTAISTPQQPEPKQPRRSQSKARNGHQEQAAARAAIKAGRKERRGDDEQEEQGDGEQEEEEEEEEDESLVVTKAPLVRSKRGRPRALPTRLRDSVVVNKVKKPTRKETK
ncbi:hypothetical protein SELMODRAFT_405718 [Selaginella moellendorffii]|uniref:Uncharacterized protein n=1 Tax=Selaginella moellendorffii TaxID=88036 RepID=D8QZH6_SELML|nr:nucleolar and coiled-body phosphoprotein 1 [Selaginella moellendorffii]EFJ34805.1 hypothetical protein SELMODRAFT_405718 [Selaginella moellendorffii]|eukprot:XP_002964472.1 nucleolar and coiled-body phosphoprotein 1 [Selaginella moellendorffii]